MRFVFLMLAAAGLATVAGCDRGAQAERPKTSDDPAIVVFNITSGAKQDAHAVTMALQLAGHALDDGRKVVLFFNVRGVTVPTTALPDDLAFHDKPIKKLLTDLVGRGAAVHVCPHCMKAMKVEAGDLLPGAIVTDREKLFANLGPNTTVFSY